MREILKSLCSERQLVLLVQNFFKCSYWQTWYWSVCKNLWSLIETIRRIIPEQPFLDFQRRWTPQSKSFLPVIKVSWLQIKIGLKMLNQLWGLSNLSLTVINLIHCYLARAIYDSFIGGLITSWVPKILSVVAGHHKVDCTHASDSLLYNLEVNTFMGKTPTRYFFFFHIWKNQCHCIPWRMDCFLALQLVPVLPVQAFRLVNPLIPPTYTFPSFLGF